MASQFSRRFRPDPEVKTGTAPNGRPYESVWSYPRPPAVLREERPVLVKADGVTIAASERALRVCETAGAPVIYIPEDDLVPGMLEPAPGAHTYCEWKGSADYFHVTAGQEPVERAAWTYRRPSPGFEQLAGHLAFYPALVECRLAGELVRPQEGGFYGGWITDEITGPIKGAAGSQGW